MQDVTLLLLWEQYILSMLQYQITILQLLQEFLPYMQHQAQASHKGTIMILDFLEFVLGS